MARSGQAGSRNQYHSGTGRGTASRSGSANRRYEDQSRGRARSDGRQHRGQTPQHHAETPQKRSPIREGQGILGWLGTMARWIVIIILVMVFIKYGKEAYTIGYAVFSEETVAADGQGTDVTVTITAAMTVDQVGELLEQNGLLVDGSVFRYQERFSSYHGDIQPGTYTLSTDMTPTEILKVISVVPDEDTAG